MSVYVGKINRTTKDGKYVGKINRITKDLVIFKTHLICWNYSDSQYLWRKFQSADGWIYIVVKVADTEDQFCTEFCLWLQLI